MNVHDILSVLIWFFALLLIGSAFLPTTFSLFSSFKDKGYVFSKILGMAILSYVVFVLGLLKVLPFSFPTIVGSLMILALLNYYLSRNKNIIQTIRNNWKIFIFEELLFLITLFFWSFVRANNPDIFGLEKFMDFGFLNSILRSTYFPPKDMWYTPLPINYYYFGHLVTAVVTKLTQIPSYISFNLMLATIFALSFSSAFSIGMNLFPEIKSKLIQIAAGFLTAALLTFGGNLTTVYAFFKAYIPQDSPVPFWTLPFKPFDFPNNYWYPNATRFIPFTIHEFPIYSFVVSDLHGHVLDIPFVLLMIAMALSIIFEKRIRTWHIFIISFLLAVMYMTNAWDGLIYLLLSGAVIFSLNHLKGGWKSIFSTVSLSDFIKKIAAVFVGLLVFSLPFSLNFKPFVSGIGILCAPGFLTRIGKIGPFLFEANHCQKSPLWQLSLLYGFFYFLAICFIVFLLIKKRYKPTPSDIFILTLLSLSTILIVVPEFIYVKDIYPTYYRANTMFKLVYQAFMMLSLSSAYIIVKLMITLKSKIVKAIFFAGTLFLSFFIFIYPFFAINSYYNNLKTYKSLDGLSYLRQTYPEDYSLINWMNANIKGQPVVLEANGDSYTQYARISANTGLPTVIGWPVHEWLWRGTYDIVAPRIADVQTLYTTNNLAVAKNLIKEYNIAYVVVSSLEYQKYPNLDQNKFNVLGKVVYNNNRATLYKINP